MKRTLNRLLLIAAPICAALLYSCASPGTPSGGARDETPPRFVKANYPLGATDVSARKITLDFNEIVTVKDPFNSVVVSPTSAQPPKVTAQGHRITVAFDDTLRSNTTYTIDFGNSIEDFNENNKLPNFAYWFSTGPEIDTLRIAGMVLAARDLEPQQAMLVGVYSQPVDSTFKTMRLERVAKTDDRGRFIIRGLKSQKYRVFALGDLNNDFRWDNPDENMAFLDIDLTPSAERIETIDTIFNMKTGEVDTVINRMRTRYFPNDVLLNSFNANIKSQYLVRNERVDSTRISLIFNTKQPELPQLSLIGDVQPAQSWYTLEHSAGNDTLTYWLRDPKLISTDTLHVAARYLRTDSANMLSAYSDTLRLITARPKVSKNNKKKKAEQVDTVAIPKILPLGIHMITSATQEVYQPLIFEFDTPLDKLDQSRFSIEQKQDTVWTRLRQPLQVVPTDSLSVRRYKIDVPWEYGGEYRLVVDTLAATGIYGNPLSPMTHTFNVRKEEEYSDLTFDLVGLPMGMPAFVELLNSSDNPIRSEVVVDGSTTFRYLMPGQYYARVVLDANGNGEYDTGSYDDHRQPEIALYYPKRVMLKANWDLAQSWDIFETPIDMQKPDILKKNKPEADKRRKQQAATDEDEDEDYFDPNANPFDPNDKKRRTNTTLRH